MEVCPVLEFLYRRMTKRKKAGQKRYGTCDGATEGERSLLVHAGEYGSSHPEAGKAHGKADPGQLR